MKDLKNDLQERISSSSQVDRRLTLSFSALILILMIIVLIISGFYLKDVMDREERKLSTILTQILATSISRVSFSGRYHAQLFIEETQKEHPDIKYLHITDLTGKIIASTTKTNIGLVQTNKTGAIVKRLLAKTITENTRITKFNGNNIIEISLPYLGDFDHSIQGVIQVGISEQTKDEALQRGVILITIMVLVLLSLAIVAVRKISRHFGNPIQHLASDMAATLQAMPDLLFELDIDGRYLQVLTHKEELLADTRENLLGKTVTEVLPEVAANEVMNALHEANNEGDSTGRQFSLSLPNGTFWFELSVALKSQKTFAKSHFIVLSRDITDRKKVESELNSHREHLEKLVLERTADVEAARDEAEQANMTKSEFLSSMSHELRTPMNAILGFGQMFEIYDDNLTPDQKENIQEILGAGYHLLNLINEILDLSKIESGKLDLTISPVAVNELLQECLSLIKPQLNHHNLTLIDEIDVGEFTVQADPTRLKQVLLNLLSNAAKYNCDNGSITLTAKTVSDQRLRIYITNTGNALSLEQIDRLFIPFDRLGITSDIEGTGIGLIITKHLIETMGGAIGVESNINQGNTFWVELILSDN